MKPYKMFSGSATEYTNLHNRIRGRIGKPKQCYLCKDKKCKFDLANLTQKYTEELSDWAYMCRSCHRRWDSPKYHWKSEVWYKFCIKCKEIKIVNEFYKKNSKVVLNSGTVYQMVDYTELCIQCSKEWSKIQYRERLAKIGLVPLHTYKKG